MIGSTRSIFSRGGSSASRTAAALRSRASAMPESSALAVTGASTTSATVIPQWRTASSRAASAGVALGQEAAGQRPERQAHPEARRDLRQDDPGDRRAGHEGEHEDPGADEQAACRRPGAIRAADPRAGERGDGQHRHGHRGGERLQRPARDQHQDEQEEHAGERRGDERERGRGQHGQPRRRRSRSRPRSPREGDRGEDRGGSLGQEDHPPVEQLGDGAADRRPDRDSEHGRRGPEP